MKITKQEYYAALGCFMASNHWRQQADALESEMGEILGYDEGDYFGHLSDEIADHHNDPVSAFNSCLAREGIEVVEDAGRDSEAAEAGSGESSSSGDGPEEPAS